MFQLSGFYSKLPAAWLARRYLDDLCRWTLLQIFGSGDVDQGLRGIRLNPTP